ncbi:hypothetical protein LJC61_00865 [Ruminococcaceae bacterium OttesenSCG-928-A16]|nr:hypothetical protein [Ruminococcaceae bacterium OttesenSCG-928-A16]
MKTFLKVLLYLVIIAAVVVLGLIITAEIAGFGSVWELFDFIKAQF